MSWSITILLLYCFYRRENKKKAVLLHLNSQNPCFLQQAKSIITLAVDMFGHMAFSFFIWQFYGRV